MKKFYVISENIVLENNNTWIIDTFKKEFMEYSELIFVQNIEEADYIWILFDNKEILKLHNMDLSNKIIISTIHHIDWKNMEIFNIYFSRIKNITTKFHVICDIVYNDLKKLTEKPIIISNFWINENIFYNIDNKKQLLEKYNIPENKYIIGSFQRDTNGKKLCMKPKLSKGPDILVNILIDIKKNNPNLLVILTGRRRNYIINEFIKHNIEYKYFEMVNSDNLNELYNCLDLYIVSSRIEGGPRSILECGLSKTPIISTNVGIVSLILDNNSIYDMNNFISYKNVNPNIEVAYNNSLKYSIKKYIRIFINNIFF